MRLSTLLASLPPTLGARIPAAGEQLPEADPVIRGLSYDSRSVAAGDLFFAVRGANVDGHDYLEQALALGAAAFVVEELPPGLDLGGRPVVVVRDSRRALAPVASSFYGNPAAELTLVGVTGTNGKTTVTYLVESILSRADRRVGLIGTVEIRYPGERQRSLNTTPESLDLQRALRSMRTHGVEAAVMEVSSHGLELGRVSGCRFNVGAFTNLTQDHLDFHDGMDAYRNAKIRLFRDHLAPGAAAVVNIDDPAAGHFERAAREAGARLIRITRDADAISEVALLEADVRMDGTDARLRLPSGEVELALPLIGDFNLENLLVASGIAVALDVDPVATAEECVRDVDIVITVTSADEPVLDGSWIAPGSHINAVGATTKHRRELDLEAVRRAGLVVVEQMEQAKADCGELIHAAESGAFDWDAAVVLKDIVSGAAQRPAGEAITLFDSLGVATEDLAAAAFVAKAAREQGIGQELPFA